MTATPPLPADLEATLVAVAISAGQAISAHYAQGKIAVEAKADASPVTQADLDAEAVILAGLASAFPAIPIISEEAAAAGQVPETGGRFFLVDPLDGTKEFISRNGEFTVNIALIEDGAPVAGVVLAPALGQVFYGDRQTGARVAPVDGGVVGAFTPIRIRPAPQDAITAVASRSHAGAETTAYLEAFGVGDCVSAGSSLKFGLVASGKADLYPRMGRTMEWDTAAGDAVLRAAGGMVLCDDGEPLAYGKRVRAGDSPFSNPHFVAVGCDALARKVRGR